MLEAERQSPGFTEGKLDNPSPLPENLRYIWHWFLELTFVGRTYSNSGLPHPLSNVELWAWCQLNQISLQVWELRLLRLLDAAWIKARSKQDG